jgi:hypothetical protein
MKPIKFKKLGHDIKAQALKLSNDGFRQIFSHINQLHIKNGLDKMGLDKFIEQCAYLAAGSGVISGSGGLITMAVGIPFDFANLIAQQFRVTMAITYYNRGSYQMDFDEFMAIVATSLKVDAGVTISKTMLESVAEKLLMLFGTRAAERLVPIVGAAIGGGTNYLFIKRMAKSVKDMQARPIVIEIN